MTALMKDMDGDDAVRGDIGDVVRTTRQLNQDGALDEAIAVLRAADPFADDTLATIYLKYLTAHQDYAALQAALRGLIAALAANRRPIGADLALGLIRSAQWACLPVEALEQVAALTAAAARAQETVRPAWNALRYRNRFRRRFWAEHSGTVSLISTGLHCLPWSLPALWGLRTPEQFVTQGTPFALAAHRIEGVIAALETGFEGYCDPAALVTVETPNGHRVAMRRDRGAVWNHNRDTYWLKDDYAAMRANLTGKAAMFKQAATRDDAVFLIAKVYEEYPDDDLDYLPRLKAAIAASSGREKNRILISNQTAEDKKPRMHVIDDEVTFFYCPYPRPDYVWHDEATEDSLEGLNYDRQYVNFIRLALLQWGVLKPV